MNLKKGAIITRGRKDADVWYMGKGSVSQKSTWYLVETNYDHWQPPPFYDQRRIAAIQCLHSDIQDGRNSSLAGIFNVLSSKPVMNKVTIEHGLNTIRVIMNCRLFVFLQLTTYTTLMEVATGQFETWIRFCSDPCDPW